MAYQLDARSVKIRQRNPELFVFLVDESVPELDEGANAATVVKNGTGDYTITLNAAARRELCVVGASPMVANLQHQIVSISASVVNILWSNNSGTATDTDFFLSLMAYYDAQKY